MAIFKRKKINQIYFSRKRKNYEYSSSEILDLCRESQKDYDYIYDICKEMRESYLKELWKRYLEEALRIRKYNRK